MDVIDVINVIDIDGNNSLGGIDIDNIILWHIINKYSIDTNNKTNIKLINKLKKCAEEIKIKLSILNNYDIFLDNIPIIKKGITIIVDNLKISFSRHLFNSLINDIIDEMILPIKQMSEKHNTNNIIFIGGPTQIPLLQTKVNLFFNNSNFNNLNGCLTLCKTIVSLGGCILYKKLLTKDNLCLLDIIPMNIGISGQNSEMIIMIDKNSKIPTSKEHIFTTCYDCQRTIDIQIYEGIDNNCELNNFIGSYKIMGIPPLPKGMIIIKLLFEISYNGILNISIRGFKNNYDNNNLNNHNYKINENIKLISSSAAKNILRKLLLSKR